MVFEIKDIKKGDIIEASLWRHNSASVGSLVIAEDPTSETILLNRLTI